MRGGKGREGGSRGGGRGRAGVFGAGAGGRKAFCCEATLADPKRRQDALEKAAERGPWDRGLALGRVES